MSATFKVACVQNCAEERVLENIERSVALIRAAAADGAELICLPENFACLEPKDTDYLTRGYTEETHPALTVFPELARELGVVLALGSLTIQRGDGRVSNRSYVFDANGVCLATYNKVHLFDVALRQGEMYRESNTVAPGETLATAELPWGKLGLSICYDVRFPHLYRELAQRGADFLAIPAAFTATTGEAHWHVLVRARAIENGCFVFAAGQSGRRHWGRRTYGHSLIVDPWGQVLADAGDDEGYVIAEVDTAKVAEARQMVPSLQHDRPLMREFSTR